MEKNPPRPMTPLDELVTPPSLYTLKLLLPYIPAHMQRMIAIFLKFYELKITMDTFRGLSSRRKQHPDNILQDIKPYMNPEEQDMMEQMQNMMNMMDMMKQMQDVSDSDSSENSAFSPFDLLQGMLPPEQQKHFQSYNQMFEEKFEEETPQFDFLKGDPHERMDEPPGDEES